MVWGVTSGTTFLDDDGVTNNVGEGVNDLVNGCVLCESMVHPEP